MRHSTIKLTADLYTDLGMTDVAEGCWQLERLFSVLLPLALDVKKDSRLDSP
jgi:hypothetical protein